VDPGAINEDRGAAAGTGMRRRDGFVIGVDTGGTFTDAFASAGYGAAFSAKVPSTPPDFAVGVLAAIDGLAAAAGRTTSELLAETAYIVHGTTSTLNALVTGDVADVGFLTTTGHADSISIMNVEGRYAGLSIDKIQDVSSTRKPEPLVARDRVCEIDERIDCDGAVVVDLNEQEVRRQVRRLVAGGVEAVAVSFLWSFRNPVHERRALQIIKEEAPELYVALSSDVSPRIGEYRRSVTTIMNTQVGPRLQGYLDRLHDGLRREGFAGALLIMQGSGGCMTSADAPSQAIATVGSVLTGGVVGCRRLASALGHRNIVSTDMGGTTFLVGVVGDGAAVTTASTVINQYTLSVPMVDVHTIGAGGGAIAWVDPGGNLRVGPRSAGASPGPACYGDGGVDPTVTDADLFLGIINPDYFLGGRKLLSTELAAKALREQVADPLGLSVDEAAAAVYAIQNGQTADLVRQVVMDSGRDPRDFVLYAYGGAGPMHCASYAADLGVQEVIVPLGSTAAVFSAYGLAACDLVLTAEHSQPGNMPVAADQMTATFQGLERDLRRRLASQGITLDGVAFEREADLRYTLQLAEVALPVTGGVLSDGDVSELTERFGQSYEQRFGPGSGFSDAGVQVITYRVRAVGKLPISPALHELPPAGRRAQPRSHRDVFLDVLRRRERTAIYDYLDLGRGDEIDGPAIVEAPTTTVAVPAGFRARVDRLGNLVIAR
jgi:N-methylhydantoinase A